MLKQLAKGMATYIPGVYQLFGRKGTGGTESARYCYSVWLRHLAMANEHGLPTNPKVIAELGPGDSIGIGLAALISGVENYYAFDIVHHASIQGNMHIYEELVQLFKDKKDIPDQFEFPEVIPNLNSYTFPSEILTDDRLKTALDEDRLNLIRQSIMDTNIDGSMIHYKAPWNDAKVIEEQAIDMILSQAVLEHVDELGQTYRTMYSWLKPNGYMSHAIDFRSHGTANEWNGHWAYSDITWRLIRGKRPYLINRLPYSQHIKLINETGLKVVCELKNELPSRINSTAIASRFKGMQQNDIVTSTAFVQSTKGQT